nr:MAG TPA: hypothetical protein [Caudoviricetes sp.]
MYLTEYLHRTLYMNLLLPYHIQQIRCLTVSI